MNSAFDNVERKTSKESDNHNVIINFNGANKAQAPGTLCLSVVQIERNKINERNNVKNLERNFVVESGSILHEVEGKIFPEEDARSKCWNCRRKSDVARERWKLLAKALLKPRKNCSKLVKDISIRRFTSFDLITPNKLENRERLDGCWLKYSTKILNNKYVIEIHHLQQKVTARELIGFNNTGNICIWPSEEVLAFYLLSNIDLFKGKEVLEVGGGMACLAGIMLGKYGKLKHIDLTDGNKLSVENIQRILRKNQLDRSKFGCYQLNWSDYSKMKTKYDFVLSSDCIFFDETRSDLVETVWHSLSDGGMALVMAPRRGNTLDLFLNSAVKKGFLCISQTYYNDVVWQQHLKFKESKIEYDEDIHYPNLLILTKSSQSCSLLNCLSSLKH